MKKEFAYQSNMHKHHFPVTTTREQVKEYIVMNPDKIRKQDNLFIVGERDEHGKLQGEQNIYCKGTHSFYLTAKFSCKNGVYDGNYHSWYEGGQGKFAAYYRDGKKSGMHQRWYKNGQMEFEGNYLNGNEYGAHSLWHENGQLKSEGVYTDGKACNLHQSWHDNGQLKSEGNYNDGEKQGIHKSWHTNGALSYQSEYIDGKQHGISRSWHENGALSFEAHHNNGKDLRLSQGWFDDGQLRYKTELVDEKNDHYIVRTWHDNGQPDTEVTFKGNAKNGTEKDYSKNGMLFREVDYKNSRYHGLSAQWHSDTNNIFKIVGYKNNEQVASYKTSFMLIQFADNVLSAFGYKRRDPQTLQSDQIAELRRRHASLRT